MSIYITGMEMPKVCICCKACFTAFGAFICTLERRRIYDDEPRPDWCPLIELPPHGRLIDADRLLEDYGLGVDCAKCKRDARSCQFEMIHTTMDFCEWIEDAPTIIPADPEGGADG